MHKNPVLLALMLFVLCSESCNNITNESVERLIDLKSQLVKVTSIIVIKNDCQDVLHNFLVYLEPESGSPSFMSVKDSHGNVLGMMRIDSSNHIMYGIKTNGALGPGQKETFVFNSVFAKALQAYPKSIRQNDKQLIIYSGSCYFYSPYRTEKQVTTVILNSKNIENYTSLSPHAVTDETIKYGPFNNVEALQHHQMTVHYESNAPFLTVTRLRRWIDVSHWGNIGLREDVSVKHTGAKLLAPFSRFDYQRSSDHHSVQSYVTILPVTARNVYYHDVNGNISTSMVRKRMDWIELELRPRYPLFGGWKSAYTLGYDVPSDTYLFRLDQKFVLQVPLMNHVFDGMHVEELQTSIVLPFGTRNVKVEVPYEVEHMPDTTVHKYLDMLGHTVVNIRKTNLVEEHIQNVRILYDWQPYVLLYEPMLLATFLFVLFLSVIAGIRFDFSQSHAKTL